DFTIVFRTPNNPHRESPFTDIVNAHLHLKNPTDRYVCFKVKTTAPKQYCVRPNSGVIPPTTSKTITVMLQPMDGIPSDVARHKFMVQTCFCQNGDVDLDNIWKVLSPNELMYSKLMVVFQQRQTDGAATVREETPSYVELEEKLRSETELRIRAEKDRAAIQQELDELFNVSVLNISRFEMVSHFKLTIPKMVI
ncbi:unnamed protein product, partial [Nippostrongylus brasiliensis]|uniref:Major sperm protein n=1 Tax=Nippostrongylus brasiliensis TaxID=27835 RepID=A0A0N4XKS4_NIPBR